LDDNDVGEEAVTWPRDFVGLSITTPNREKKEKKKKRKKGGSDKCLKLQEALEFDSSCRHRLLAGEEKEKEKGKEGKHRGAPAA